MKRRILIALLGFWLLLTCLVVLGFATLYRGEIVEQNRLKVQSQLKSAQLLAKDRFSQLPPGQGLDLEGGTIYRLRDRSDTKLLPGKVRSLLPAERFDEAKGEMFSSRYDGAASGTMTSLMKAGDGFYLYEVPFDIKKAEGTAGTSYLAGLVLFLSLASILAVGFIARYIMEPLEDLVKASGQIANGDFTARLKVKDSPELSAVADHFNILADRLETTVMDSVGNQHQLEAILGSMNSGVIAVDKNNKIIIFNTFARKIFGVFSEAIGKDIGQVIKNTDLAQLMEVSDHFQELSLMRKTNTVVRYRTTEIIADRHQQKGKVTVIQDITDLKKLEQMRSQFVANVSHELKTPLTSIKGFSETLRDVEDPVTKNKFLDIIDQEAERLRRLIEDILSLAAIENQEESSMVVISAGEDTVNALKLFETQVKAKHINLALTLRGNPRFIGDPDMYRQMIINLVDNAIKYTDHHGRVALRLEEEADVVRLTVSDTGIGIPREHLGRLFERFYRVDKSRDRGKGGTGLGLAIVKHIVLAFDGEITVDSELGKGTTFTVIIPAHRPEGQKPEAGIQTFQFPLKLQKVNFESNKL